MAESYSIILHISHLHYPFICLWTLRSLPYLGFYKQCCYEHGVPGSFGVSVLVLLFFGGGGGGDIYLGMGLLSHMVVYSFLKIFHTGFHSGCINTFLPTVYKVGSQYFMDK